MSGYFNPYTNSYSWEQDLKDHPECKGKILAIAKRLNLQPEEIKYADIAFICQEWGCMNAGDFYEHMRNLSDKDLRDWVERAKKRRKGLMTYLEQQGLVSVPSYIS